MGFYSIRCQAASLLRRTRLMDKILVSVRVVARFILPLHPKLCVASYWVIFV
jgi:hypothetical protein